MPQPGELFSSSRGRAGSGRAWPSNCSTAPGCSPITCGPAAGAGSAGAATREELAEALAGIAPHAGDIAFFSTVTAGRLDTAGLDAEYWFRNLRETV